MATTSERVHPGSAAARANRRLRQWTTLCVVVAVSCGVAAANRLYLAGVFVDTGVEQVALERLHAGVVAAAIAVAAALAALGPPVWLSYRASRRKD